MPYRVTIPPATEPITLAEAKAQLRVLDGVLTEDALISAYIAAARDYAESVTGRVLITQTIEEYYDQWAYVFCLSKSPISAITKVEYIADGTTTYVVWDSSNYAIDLLNVPARAIKLPSGVFQTLAILPNPVKITYVAGGTANEIPSSIKQAIMLLISDYYENRQDSETTLVTTKGIAQIADKLLSLNRLVL